MDIFLAAAENSNSLETYIAKLFALIIAPIVGIIFIIATIVFMWGVIEMLMHADDPDAKTRGARHMLWGIIGLVIMFAASGLLFVICDFFNESCEVYELYRG